MPSLHAYRGSPRPGEERRETERALAYWLECAAPFGGRPPTASALDLERILTAGSEYRFVIACDAVPEDSALVICGARFARLLELPARTGFCVPMSRQVPQRLLAIFAAGCRDAALSGAPIRCEGAVALSGGRHQLYRTIFMPVGVNLIFGAFNSRIVEDEALLGNIQPALRTPALVGRLIPSP
jgi:hypothetical protein